MLCECGTEFKVAPWQLKRKYPVKYCSADCMYKYREKKVNAGCFKPGERPSPKTEFKKGEIPHNFKEEGVGYDALHDWVRRHKGKASAQICKCGKPAKYWANLSWEYKRDLTDYEAMCKMCHIEYDRKGNWGAATRQFPELQKRGTR